MVVADVEAHSAMIVWMHGHDSVKFPACRARALEDARKTGGAKGGPAPCGPRRPQQAQVVDGPDAEGLDGAGRTGGVGRDAEAADVGQGRPQAAEDAACAVEEHLAREGEVAGPAAGGAAVGGELILLDPAEEDALVRDGVLVGADGVEASMIDDTIEIAAEVRCAVGRLLEGTREPEAPLAQGLVGIGTGLDAALCAHEEELALLDAVAQGHEVAALPVDAEVAVPGTRSTEAGANVGEGAEVAPGGEVVGGDGIDEDGGGLADNTAREDAVEALFAADAVEGGPGGEEGVAEAGDAETLGLAGDDGVEGALLPGAAVVGGRGEGDALGVAGVLESPVDGEGGDGGVDNRELAGFAVGAGGPEAAGEDALLIVGLAGTQSRVYGTVVPAQAVGAGGVAPGDVAPVTRLRVPCMVLEGLLMLGMAESTHIGRTCGMSLSRDQMQARTGRSSIPVEP
jgi:hypothetical protein